MFSISNAEQFSVNREKLIKRFDMDLELLGLGPVLYVVLLGGENIVGATTSPPARY